MIDFKKDVIDRSFQVPVVVDFWAPWCGPCRVLGPIIENIAEEQKGRWELVKVNTEEQPELGDAYNVRSIPNVKLFYRGEVVHEFLGSLPRQTILEWLRKTLPGEGLMALDHSLEENPNPNVNDLEALLSKYPESEEIRLVLGQLLLWDNPVRAREVLSTIKLGSPFYQKVSSLQDILSFLLHDSTDAQIVEAQTTLRDSRVEDAIPVMLDALSKNIEVANGTLSKATIGLFNVLGAQHPFTKKYRKQLDMYLWK